MKCSNCTGKHAANSKECSIIIAATRISNSAVTAKSSSDAMEEDL